MAINTTGAYTGGAHISTPLPTRGFNTKQFPTNDSLLLTLLSEQLPPIRLLAEKVDYHSANAAGSSAHAIEVTVSNEEMNRLMGGGADSVQFMRDQIANYEDAFSKDFALGFKTAIEVLMGKQTLEDLLPEEY